MRGSSPPPPARGSELFSRDANLLGHGSPHRVAPPQPLTSRSAFSLNLQPSAQRRHSVEAEAGKCPPSPCPGAFPHANRTEWKLHKVPTPRAPSRLAPGAHVGTVPQPRTLRPP
uniref:Uncharacterized protein n=1 Tax=Rangifer tarandus platyrhynchus TaxID=3082113 RepID=A0ACB0F794_RANTA|nr:unnamed protein product [Rangifer tarandus platyrhynchus]